MSAANIAWLPWLPKLDIFSLICDQRGYKHFVLSVTQMHQRGFKHYVKENIKPTF